MYLPGTLLFLFLAALLYSLISSTEANCIGQNCLNPDMSNKRALVVGGTSGIGRGLAEYLAKQGVSVTIAGRNAQMGATIVKELGGLTPAGSPAEHAFAAVDGFDLASVAQLAKEQTKQPLDLLVMSQGMATLQGYTPTKDGTCAVCAVCAVCECAVCPYMACVCPACPIL